MGKIKTYRDLIVWQKSMELVSTVYEITRQLPAEELYGLTAQIRRAAVSIPSNIAEGYARNSGGDFARFLRIACGSLYELSTQLEIAANLGFLRQDVVEALAEPLLEIAKMLSSLIGKVHCSADRYKAVLCRWISSVFCPLTAVY